MFWNKKDDKSTLPDLPPRQIQRPEPSSSPYINTESYKDDYQPQELPSFPDSMNNQGFSQAAIKDAISQNNSSKFQDNKDFNTANIEEWNPQQTINPSSTINEWTNISSYQNTPGSIIQPPTEKLNEISLPNKNKDIYVKLDKFYSARKSLAEANEKLNDVDVLLNKIRETKLKEEQELTNWEKELMEIKSKVNDINLNLFEKID